VPRKSTKSAPQRPKGCYLRGTLWWGRIEIGGHEYREPLRTTDPEEAGNRRAEWVAKLRAEARSAQGMLHVTLPAGDDRGPQAGNIEPAHPVAVSPVRGEPTFQDAVVKWEAEVADGSKPSVRKRYLVSVGQLDPIFGHLSMSQITAERVSAFVSHRKREKRSTRKGLNMGKVKVCNATIRRDLTALSRILSCCCSWGWRIDNPALSYDRRLIRETRKPSPPPARCDIETVLAACPPAVASIVRLLDSTGMRMMEAVQIERWQVDAEQRTIVLSRTKSNRPRTLAWSVPGADATQALHEGAKQGFLYRGDNGSPYANFSSNFSQILRRVAAQEKAAGRDFRRFSLKDLRSGFAIRWLNRAEA
jgi:integrase/recombinase XerD